MAPEIDDEIEQGLHAGQLRIITAKTIAVAPTQTGARIVYRRRGKTEEETLDVAKVAECTGVYTDPLATINPLLQQLIAKGLARPDPLGIGIDVSDNCAIIDRNGVSSRVLYGVGPLTRAAFWEIMAVPDIRVQCAELGGHLLMNPHGSDERRRLAGGIA